MSDEHDDFDYLIADGEDAAPQRPDIGAKPSGKTLSADRALVAALFKTADTAAIREFLKCEVPQVIQLVAPSATWAKAVSNEIGRSYDKLVAVTVTERNKSGNDWLLVQLLARLSHGGHTIISCTDASELLPPAVARAVDFQLALPQVDAAMMRAAIRLFTGQRATGLKDEDLAELDFPDLVLCLRQGSTAGQCVERIRNVAQVRLKSQSGSDIGPRLEDLPLPAAIADWSRDMLADLQAVTRGDLSPDQLRHGVLEGPPGTGKTLIAGALARSAGWRFQSASLGDWFNSSDGNLGGVSKAIVGYFDELLKFDRVVGFVDECDSFPSRIALDASDRQWWTTVVNLMLTQIDRLRLSGKRVLLLAATNLYDFLDPALVRGGRLEQRVTVLGPQTEEEALDVLAHHVKAEISRDALQPLARFVFGATPASIAGWARTARAVARREGRAIGVADLFGVIAPADTRGPAEIREVAIHEAGHALVAVLLGLDLVSVSIISSGRVGGMTRTAELTSALTRAEVEDLATAYLGGRAADLTLGRGSHSGAALDIEMARTILGQACCHWGLYGIAGQLDPGSEEVAVFLERTIKRLLARALRLLADHREALAVLTDALVEKRLLKADEVQDLLALHLLVEKAPEHTAGTKVKAGRARTRPGGQTKRGPKLIGKGAAE
ncbi:AAA family ATPase [Devosia sp. CAU 1758]